MDSRPIIVTVTAAATMVWWSSSLTVQTLGFLLDSCEFDSVARRDIFLLSGLRSSPHTSRPTILLRSSRRSTIWSIYSFSYPMIQACFRCSGRSLNRHCLGWSLKAKF